MPLAYWCVLVAALLPYGWAKYAQRGVPSDNRMPRDDYRNYPPVNRRAYAAHQNALESFRSSRSPCSSPPRRARRSAP
jgi:uncharacterized MAPEG superfamily protein